MDIIPKTQTKEKINKWDYIKWKSFYTVKETSTKWKGHLQNGKDIANDIANIRLISKLYFLKTQTNSGFEKYNNWNEYFIRDTP